MSGLEGVIVYLDDILVIHDHRLRRVLEKLNDWGFRLQVEKMQIQNRKCQILRIHSRQK